MVHIYVAKHQGPDPEAPEPRTAMVSPVEVSIAQLVHAVRPLQPERVLTYKHYELTYPEVSDVPARAVAEVRRRYADCARCPLAERRDRIVHVRGNLNAVAVAMGEGPGKDENISGLPFTGRAGRLQNELLRDGNIDPRRDIAWMNLVGCRPSDAHRWEQEDRPPSTLEKVACSERTLMLFRAIRPRVVLCLGKIATSFFFENPPPVNTWTTIRPAGHPEDRVFVAHLRHPSFLARSVMVPKQYKEYAAAVRFYQRLAERLPGLTKVTRWRFHPKYVEWLQSPEVGA